MSFLPSRKSNIIPPLVAAFCLLYVWTSAGSLCEINRTLQNGPRYGNDASSNSSLRHGPSQVHDASAPTDEAPSEPASSQAVTTTPTSSGSRLCEQNPYRQALSEPFETIALRVDEWIDQVPSHLEKANNDTMWKHNHKRFFPFDKDMATCKKFDCVGGGCRRDTSKIVCGLDQLQQQQQQQQQQQGVDEKGEACVVYSIGGNNQWEFELDLLEKTPCNVHTFDCTGSPDRFQKPDNDRLTFHHVCLGTEHEPAADTCKGREKCGETWTMQEMQQKLQHTRIDLLKIDVEGFEWPLLESWPLNEENKTEASQTLLPMQLLVEVHYESQFPQLYDPDLSRKYPDRPRRKMEFKFAPDVVHLQERLLKMGYVVVERDDNRACRHCTELTLVRMRCPGDGVYAAGAVAVE